jgi:hypothetical protein
MAAVALTLPLALVWSPPAASSVVAAKRPPIPAAGIEVAPGQLPTICDGPADNAYGVNYGYYYSVKARAWLQAPRCVPKWGNLAAMQSQVVGSGQRVTMTAVPDEGSNSGTYAPQTSSITWTYPGQRVAGCGSTDLTCTVIPFPKATEVWQWGVFNVSMPRTFFVDSAGSNCAGQHLCAGNASQAWGVVGVAPKGSDTCPPRTRTRNPALTPSAKNCEWDSLMISGVVLNRHGQPQRGATVYVKALGPGAGGARRTKTDAHGRYSFKLDIVTSYQVAMNGYCAYGQPGCSDTADVHAKESHTGTVVHRNVNWHSAAMNCKSSCTFPPGDIVQPTTG